MTLSTDRERSRYDGDGDSDSCTYPGKLIMHTVQAMHTRANQELLHLPAPKPNDYL